MIDFHLLLFWITTLSKDTFWHPNISKAEMMMNKAQMLEEHS
jgi:hypothetical protein